MRVEEMRYRPVSKLHLLDTNPREITPEDFNRLVESIRDNGFWPHRPLALEERDGVWVVLAGNQRLKVAKKLKLKEVPTILYSDLTDEERNDIILRDNINNGSWNYQTLKVDTAFKTVNFERIGLTFPTDKKTKKTEKKKQDEPAEDDTDGDIQDVPFAQQLAGDVLYDSDNDFEIPNLLLEQQAGRLELPFTPWGANSRLRKDVKTYHFYVDDYRFEALFKDPINLITSGCKAIVEPNCSCHDQTPIAYGLQLIYKKRWLARYLQEIGIKVYADLNVSHKFIGYNKMGIPKGYNAFFTRGLEGWIDSLKSDFQVAQEISGLERPNLIVYGGGREIEKFCQDNGLLYVTDFINAKKI